MMSQIDLKEKKTKSFFIPVCIAVWFLYVVLSLVVKNIVCCKYLHVVYLTPCVD